MNRLTIGYKQRMRRIALSDPLYELDRKLRKDDEGEPIDMRALGMITLLFFFERKLSRQYKTSRAHLTQFLFEMTEHKYSISSKQLKNITDILIDVFRPTRGRKREYSFYNWETKTEEVIEYSILKDNGFDQEIETQYYTLDDDGLELLFATKEFYSEFQISINQLLLKQQLKKGQFNDALRQIREMEVEVETIQERMENMKLEISRTIVSEETFNKYKNLLDDTYLRLEREDEEFTTLKHFIIKTRDTFYEEDLKLKEGNSFRLISQIQHELDRVHYLHDLLLQFTSELKTITLEQAQESLYYTGIQAFNFDQDIVSTILATPLNPNKMKGTIHPFLKVEQNETWSPFTLFAEQNIVEERSEREADTFVTAESETEEQTYRKWIAKQYGKLMVTLIDSYEKHNIKTLGQLIVFLKAEKSPMLDRRYFYNFWLLIHQQSPLSATMTIEHERETILTDMLRALNKKQLIVKELKNIIHFNEKYSIQNMSFKLTEEQTDEI